MAMVASLQRLQTTLTKHMSIDDVAHRWDQLVPRDLPHLRAGFIRAAERGGMLKRPSYLLVDRGDRLVAVALAFTVVMDSSVSSSPRARKWIDLVRKVYPNFLWRAMRVSGPPVSNGECGFYVDNNLPPDERRHVFRQLMSAVIDSAGRNQLIFVGRHWPLDESRDPRAIVRRLPGGA
jgi:hypothetical protein